MSAAANHGWATVLLGALAEVGAGRLFVSPGSRSTPLVLAAVELGLPCDVVIDERAAAFAALGWSRATRRPAVLVCTSGTAGAHYLPAIVEATAARTPLLALTADRPLELHGCGAAQTIDQARLFGLHATYLDAGPPSDEVAALRALRRRAAQAVAAALGPPAGAVHINAPFGAPLEPGDGDAARRVAERCAEATAAPLTRVGRPRRPPGDDDVAALVDALDAARRPLVAVGPLPVDADAARLVERLGAPYYAEATSGVPGGRLGPLLAGRATMDALAPDLLIEIGSPPVAPTWARLPAARRVVVAPDGWPDPAATAERVVRGELGELAARLPARSPSAWSRRIAGLAERAAAVAGVDLAGEPRAIAGLLAALSPAVRLALGNSLPARLVDLVPWRRPGAVLSQRGAAGIDGHIAGAAGAARAGHPVVALIGDVAFAHDVGGLLVARAAEVPLVIAVVDNGGGRIFDGLPVARAVAPAILERFYTTPPGLDPVAVAAACGVPGRRLGPGEVERAVGDALARPGATLLHLAVEPGSAGRYLATLGAAVDRACAGMVAG